MHVCLGSRKVSAGKVSSCIQISVLYASTTCTGSTTFPSASYQFRGHFQLIFKSNSNGTPPWQPAIRRLAPSVAHIALKSMFANQIYAIVSINFAVKARAFVCICVCVVGRFLVAPGTLMHRLYSHINTHTHTHKHSLAHIFMRILCSCYIMLYIDGVPINSGLFEYRYRNIKNYSNRTRQGEKEREENFLAC